MKIKLQVIQHRTSQWRDKTNREHTDHVVVGVDADSCCEQILEVMCQGMIPDDQQKLFPAGSLVGKVVEMGVSRIIPLGGVLKFVGRVMTVGGKPLGDEKGVTANGRTTTVTV